MINFMSHFDIENILKTSMDKVMNSDNFIREAMLGGSSFVYKVDDLNLSENIGLYTMDITLSLWEDGKWVVKSIDFYSDLIFLARHDYNYDIGVKFYYHITSCNIKDMTVYESNILYSLLVFIFNQGDSSVDLDCDISKFGAINRTTLRLNSFNVNFMANKIKKYNNFNLKIKNELVFDISFNYQNFTDILSPFLYFYEHGNNFLCDNCVLFVSIHMRLDDNSNEKFNEELYCILNMMINKLSKMKFLNRNIYLYLDTVGTWYMNIDSKNNLLLSQEFKEYFHYIALNNNTY